MPPILLGLAVMCWRVRQRPVNSADPGHLRDHAWSAVVVVVAGCGSASLVGKGQGRAGRGVIDDGDPQGGFEQETDAPYGGDDPEDVPEALILPQADHLAAFSGIRADELQGEAVYRASLRWTRHAIAALRAAPAPSAQPSSR
jgi:hypothetical protein